MKKRNKKRAEMNSENVTQLDPASGPNSSELQFNVSHPVSGPRPTGQPAILHLNGTDAVHTPPPAAVGDGAMKQPSKSESITERDPAAGPTNSELQFNFPQPLSGPRSIARSTFNELDPGMPMHVPAVAAKGDDDLMSQKQKQS